MKPTIEELGFSYPIETSKVIDALNKHYGFNNTYVISAIDSVLEAHRNNKEFSKAYVKTIRNFRDSGISFFDKHFMGLSVNDSVCAVACGIDVKYKQVLKLLAI